MKNYLSPQFLELAFIFSTKSISLRFWEVDFFAKYFSTISGTCFHVLYDFNLSTILKLYARPFSKERNLTQSPIYKALIWPSNLNKSLFFPVHDFNLKTLILGIKKTSFILLLTLTHHKATIDTKIMVYLFRVIFRGVRCVSFLLSNTIGWGNIPIPVHASVTKTI